MGKYISYTSQGFAGTTFAEKSEAIKADGATPIEEPKEWKENLVVVVDNESFAAVAYAHNEAELIRFKSHYDGRIYQWYNYPNASQFAV